MPWKGRFSNHPTVTTHMRIACRLLPENGTLTPSNSHTPGHLRPIGFTWMRTHSSTAWIWCVSHRHMLTARALQSEHSRCKVRHHHFTTAHRSFQPDETNATPLFPVRRLLQAMTAPRAAKAAPRSSSRDHTHDLLPSPTVNPEGNPSFHGTRINGSADLPFHVGSRCCEVQSSRTPTQ
jgi:hypothetical protein